MPLSIDPFHSFVLMRKMQLMMGSQSIFCGILKHQSQYEDLPPTLRKSALHGRVVTLRRIV